jgi:hypothetical protein
MPNLRYSHFSPRSCLSSRENAISESAMAFTPKRTRRGQDKTAFASRIADLKRQRAELEEEILQLKAAVDVWTEVCRQTGMRRPVAQDLAADPR